MSDALTPQEHEVLRALTEEVAVLAATVQLEGRITRFCFMLVAVVLIYAPWLAWYGLLPPRW
jgi:hypothetical protein